LFYKQAAARKQNTLKPINTKQVTTKQNKVRFMVQVRFGLRVRLSVNSPEAFNSMKRYSARLFSGRPPAQAGHAF
jgi:hypothetical protein